jgi:hypothetical protein
MAEKFIQDNQAYFIEFHQNNPHLKLQFYEKHYQAKSLKLFNFKKILEFLIFHSMST